MSLNTIGKDPKRLDGWTPRVEDLQAAARGFEIEAKTEMRACGCGIKLDLYDIVYPALRAAAEELSAIGVQGIGTRTDFFAHSGRLESLERIVFLDEEIKKKAGELASRIAANETDALVEVYSSNIDYSLHREKLRAHFADVASAKARIWATAQAKKAASGTGPLRFGKGHSIGAGGNFTLVDLLKFDDSAGYTAANNDTIATADSMLRHGCAISVMTALNNSLNDLFLAGVSDDLRIFPVYDGSADEVQAIHTAIDDYVAFFSERGVKVKVEDRGPLGLGVRMIGATVTGHARHELPGLHRLLPGQKIMATRHLGDLSLLAAHRALHFPETPHAELDALRWKVLQQFCTPNYLAATILQKYLPVAGEPFRPDRHITFASDVSGPGFYVLEEGATASRVSVHIQELKFMHEGGLGSYRRNQLSSTNGPILFSAYPEVAEQVERELLNAGYSQCWNVGVVTERDPTALIKISQKLRDKHTNINPRLDFFAPEVHFGEGESLVKERMPIFQSATFVED